MAVLAHQMVAFEWSMVALTFSLVALRVYVQIHNSIHPYVSLTQRVVLEALVIFAWLSFMIGAVMDTMLIPLGGLDPDYQFPPTPATIKILKIYYAQSVTYLNPMYAIKLHMLLFYHAAVITPGTDMRKTYHVLRFTTVFVVVAWLTELFVSAFACIPVSNGWNLEAYCSAHDKLWAYLIKYVPHMLTDLMVYFLPIPVLWRLRNITRRQKAFAAISFGFGFCCVAFAATQVTTGLPSLSIPLAAGYVTAVMEQTWALLVVCVPAFKVFMRRTMERDPESVFSLRREPGASDEKPGSFLQPLQKEVSYNSRS